MDNQLRAKVIPNGDRFYGSDERLVVVESGDPGSRDYARAELPCVIGMIEGEVVIVAPYRDALETPEVRIAALALIAWMSRGLGLEVSSDENVAWFGSKQVLSAWIQFHRLGTSP